MKNIQTLEIFFLTSIFVLNLFLVHYSIQIAEDMINIKEHVGRFRGEIIRLTDKIDNLVVKIKKDKED